VGQFMMKFLLKAPPAIWVFKLFLHIFMKACNSGKQARGKYFSTQIIKNPVAVWNAFPTSLKREAKYDTITTCLGAKRSRLFLSSGKPGTCAHNARESPR